MENLRKLVTAIAVGYFRKGSVWNALRGFECVLNLFLLPYLSIIQVLLYSFNFLFINLCVCFKSVYTGRFLLLFPRVSMFYHFCLRNLQTKTFIRIFFNLLIKL